MAWFVWIKRKDKSRKLDDVWAMKLNELPEVEDEVLKIVQKHELDNRDMGCRLSALMDKYPYKPIKDLT